MKKFLMVSGVIFWIVIFAGVAAFLWGVKLDASSKAYVDKNVPIIISTWSKQELLKCASPELNEVCSNRPADLDQPWSRFEKLGTLTTYNGSKGTSRQNAYFWLGKNGQRGYDITAKYVAKADFQNGSANITVDLVRENGEWEINGFYVDSPFSHVH